MNKFRLSTFFLFTFFLNYSQNKLEKYLFDTDTGEALKGATITNSKNSTITNDEGHFVFYSINDSITIRMIGYDKLQTTFQALETSQDTIYLSQSPILLDEIIVKDYEKLVFNTYNAIQKNYLHKSHVNAFFLRCILKKNNAIIKIEDISGRIKRNTMFATENIPKIEFEFELLNQRKVGVLAKDKKVEDFNLLTLDQLFNWYATLFINPNHFVFIEEKIIDTSFSKINYYPYEEYKNKSIGYYIINKNDHSISEYFSKTNPLFKEDIVFEEKRGFRWRTIDSELYVNFNKSIDQQKYYMSSANLIQTIEIFNREKERNIYEVEYQLITTEPFLNNQDFNFNVKNDKSLFELNIDYDAKFWETQNQLPLTKGLHDFIDSLNNYGKDYIIISNF